MPEFTADQEFYLGSTKIIDEFQEAKKLGITTRPVLLGPVSYLLLGKSRDPDCRPLDLIGRVLPVYRKVLDLLRQKGASWIQIDEPILALDLSQDTISTFRDAYHSLLSDIGDLKISLNSYFASIFSEKL